MNDDGTEELLLVFIEKLKIPKCFNGKKSNELCFEYYFILKSWMNTGIFFEWFKSFDSHIGGERNRKPLLLISNASCHGILENLPNFLRIEFIFLPARTTSKLQSLDSGIIVALKSYYRCKKIGSALDYSRKFEIDLKCR